MQFSSSYVMEMGWKPNVEISPTCPRCGSSNTKFCYYNNYSLTQPRYFCKGCRRYWTKGGSLRNVPVGGGCRKSRRGKPIRVSTDGGVPSNGAALGHCGAGLGHNGTPFLSESTGSLFGTEASSNIDLALVYANFLNHKPQPEPQLDIPELPNAVVGPSFEFTNVESLHMRLNTQLAQERSFVDCPQTLSERSSDTHVSDGNAFYLCGFDSTEKQQVMDLRFASVNLTNNYALAPLPGEETLAIDPEGMAWPSSDLMFPNHTLHSVQSSGLLPQAQDPNQLHENGSPLIISNSGIK